MSAGSTPLRRRPLRKRFRHAPPARHARSTLRAAARTADAPLSRTPSAAASYARTTAIAAWAAADGANCPAHRLYSP